MIEMVEAVRAPADYPRREIDARRVMAWFPGFADVLKSALDFMQEISTAPVGQNMDLPEEVVEGIQEEIGQAARAITGARRMYQHVLSVGRDGNE